jgi:hypothetical protein
MDRAPERRSIFASMSPPSTSDAPHSFDVPSLPGLPIVVPMSPRTLAQLPPPPEVGRPAPEPARQSPEPARAAAAVADAQARRTRTGDAKADARAAAAPADARTKTTRAARTNRNSIGTRQKRRAEARAVLEAALLFEAAPRPQGKEVPDSSRTAARAREKRMHWAWFVVPAVVALSFFVAALAQDPAPVEHVSTPAPRQTSDSTPSELTPRPAPVEPAAARTEVSDSEPEYDRKPAKTTRTGNRPKAVRPKPTSSELKNPFD